MKAAHRITTCLMLLALLALASCHTTRRIVQPEKNVEPDPPTAITNTRAYTIVQFTAEVEGTSVSGQLRMAEDSVIWVSVNKFIEVGRALATTDSLFLNAPLLGSTQATTYADLQQRTQSKITFDQLQNILLDNDAEQRIAELAKRLGYNAKVHIVSRRKVQSLNFPYTR